MIYVESPNGNNCCHSNFEKAFEKALSEDNGKFAQTVFIPSGTYKLSKKLIIDKNFCLVGENVHSTIIKPTNDFKDDVLIEIHNQNSKIMHSKIENITLSGNEKAIGLKINWAHNFLLDRVNLERWDLGLHITTLVTTDEKRDWNTNFVYKESMIELCKNGILSGSEEESVGGNNNCSHFKNLRIAGKNREGTGIELRRGYSQTITGCDIEGNSIGIHNKSGSNKVFGTLCEQNGEDIKVEGGCLSMFGSTVNTMPANQQDYEDYFCFQKNGLVRMHSFDIQLKNLVDTSSQTRSRHPGSTGKSVFVITQTPQEFPINIDLLSTERWYTISIRAKKKTEKNSSLYLYLKKSNFLLDVEKHGIARHGTSPFDYYLLQAGVSHFTGGRLSSGNLAAQWNIYIGHFKIKGFPDGKFPDQLSIGLRVSGNSDGALVDYFTIYPGLCGFGEI